MNKLIAAIAITATSFAATAAFAESASVESRARLNVLWDGVPTSPVPYSTGVLVNQGLSGATISRSGTRGTVRFGGADTGAIEPNRRFFSGRDVSK